MSAHDTGRGHDRYIIWGEHVSYPVYLDCIWIFNGTPYLNWAEGYLPWVTNVWQVHSSLEAKLGLASADFSSEIAQLEAKLDLLHEKLSVTTQQVSDAFAAGTAILTAP